MGSVEEAQAVLDALIILNLMEETMRIDEARPMQPRRDFGQNRFGGFSSGGGFNRRRY
jgi:hypothetical protein